MSLTLCVYCGARPGVGTQWLEQARLMGQAIAQRGWQVVYGGGHVGLMGAVADACLAAGGRVTGVIPQRLLKWEVAHRGLSALEVVDTMHQRKQRMAEMADGFVALPGGIGTFEELFEVWTWRHLGYHDRPIGLLNTAGFYDDVLRLMDRTESAGFTDAAQRSMLTVESEVDALLDALAPQLGRSNQASRFEMV